MNPSYGEIRGEFAATTEEIGVMAWVAAGVLCAFGQFVVIIVIVIVIVIIIIAIAMLTFFSSFTELKERVRGRCSCKKQTWDRRMDPLIERWMD